MTVDNERIFEAAVYNDADVPISGAFGCGVFGNDPGTVAEAAAEKYSGYFDKVVFAIPNDRDSYNYDVLLYGITCTFEFTDDEILLL